MLRFNNMKTTVIVYAFLWVIFAIQFGILIVQFQKSSHQYSNFLTDRFMWSCGGMFALLTVFMLVGVVFFTKFDHDCIENWMIIVWTLFIIAMLIWLQYQFQSFNKDIQIGDYVVYNGDFEKDSTRGFIFLSDGSSTRIYNTNDTFLEPGHYSGEVVYSKRTKYVLSYILDSGENSNVP